MKFTGYIFLLMTLATHANANGNEQLIEESYDCEIGGCVLACVTPRGDRQVVSDSARQVQIRHFPSGNVEYVLTERSGSNPVRRWFDHDSLQCVLTGLR